MGLRGKMNKDYFFDEELEELTYERMEKSLGEKVIAPMREEDDKGWNEPRQKEKLKLIVEDTQGLIDKRLLL